MTEPRPWLALGPVGETALRHCTTCNTTRHADCKPHGCKARHQPPKPPTPPAA